MSGYLTPSSFSFALAPFYISLLILFLHLPVFHTESHGGEMHRVVLAFTAVALYRVFTGPRKHVLIFNAALSRAGGVGPNLEACATMRQEKQDKE